jgi:hypothetical protein
MCASIASGKLSAQPPAVPYGMPGVSQPPDVRWIESLIANGFARYAVEVCESRLQLVPPDSDAYAQWMMLAMQAATSQALDAFDFSGDPQGLNILLQTNRTRSESMKGVPRELWIRSKNVWCQWLVHQRGLASYLAVPSRESLKQWIVTSIRTSLDEVEGLQQQVRRLPSGPGKTISNEQRLDLQGSLDLLHADLLYQRSQCYPQGSDDRLAAASEMLRSLDQALGKLPADWLHRPSLAIARVRAQILLEQYDDALTSANKLWESLHAETETSSPTAQYEQALCVVGARAARMKDRMPEFDQWISRGGGAMASPELALEQFAADLEQGGEAAAERSLQWKRNVRDRFGPYWEQRIDALIVSNKTTQPSANTASLEILRIEVRQLLAAKRWTDAIAKLQQAELAASQLNAEEEAFTFAMQVGAAHESLGNRGDAAQAFFDAATKYPSQPKAPSASLMSAWLIRPTAGSPPKLDSYRERLTTTARRWPTSDSAAQAVDWFERDCLAQDAIAPVLDLWCERVAGTKKTSSAMGRYLLAYCLMNDAWIESIPFNDGDVAEPFERLRMKLIDGYVEVDREPYQKWIMSTQSDLRWSVPEFRGDTTTWFGGISKIASGSFEANAIEELAPKELATWGEDPLERIGVLWYACEARAMKRLSQPNPASPTEALLLGKLVGMLRKERESETPYPLGPIIDSRLQRSIRFYEILAAGEQGDWDGAFKKLDAERTANKKSAWWLYRSARAMQSVEAHRKDALPWYRLLASGFPAGSEPWFEARARTAQTMRWTNDMTAADQLRDLVFATYPGAETVWRSRFESK